MNMYTVSTSQGSGRGGFVFSGPARALTTAYRCSQSLRHIGIPRAILAGSVGNQCDGGFVMDNRFQNKDQVNARFWSHVEKTDACWLWRGHINGDNHYGQMSINGKEFYMHRFSYELSFGLIPSGMWVLHTCDIRHCVNPAHLYVGDTHDNNRDRQQRGRQAKGERCGATKLSAAQVTAIRQAHGTVPRLVLASEYGVSLSLIAQIVGRRVWRHIA